MNAIAAIVPSCLSAKAPCNGTCSGYGTCCDCPPLLVFAMLLSEAAARAPCDGNVGFTSAVSGSIPDASPAEDTIGHRVMAVTANAREPS
jgi:hypothetical protein